MLPVFLCHNEILPSWLRVFFFFNIKETHHVFIGQEFLFSLSGEIFVRSQKIEKVTVQPRTLK